MFVLGYLLRSLTVLLHFLLQFAMILFLVRAVMSWFQPDRRQPVVNFIYSVTDPILERLRRVIPPMGAVDLSPVVAILICWVLDNVLVPSLLRIGSPLLQ